MLYLRLALEQFTCDKEKIFWTLAFFKDGCAAKWSENLFHQEADNGIFPIQSWTDFEQQFRSQFFLVNAEADAINTLEGSSYYQGNWTVDDYLDSFLILASDAEYTDPRTLVVKFRRGLKLNVQSQITTMLFRRPADTDPEAWYAAANYLVKDCPRRLDIQRLTAEQREELIEDLMALKDAVEEEEVCSASEKGFV